ncbi:MAG: flagellin FliC [Deltaproteobacteria bacterium]|nr:MAG: flagellin FliC [Deltaproteobacteria bacterium]
MAISLRTNIASLTASTKLGQTTLRVEDNMRKLASGLRINSAGDDAAGLAISEKFRANIRSLAQLKRNANDGISLIQTAEGALSEISNILIRMRELAVQAATDTVATSQKAFLQTEFEELRDEITRIGQTAEFNGLTLLSGAFATTATALTFQVDLGGDPNQQISVQLATMSPDALGITGIAMTTSDDARAALSVLDTALQNLSSQRATLGAAQNRLQMAINNIDTMSTNVSAANSRIRDVDVAEETARLAQNQILMQSGAAVLAQANQIPSLALSLLQG